MINILLMWTKQWVKMLKWKSPGNPTSWTAFCWLGACRTEAADCRQASACTIFLKLLCQRSSQGWISCSEVTLVQPSSCCKYRVRQGVSPRDVLSPAVRRKEFLTSSGQNNGKEQPWLMWGFFGEFSCFPQPSQDWVFSFNHSANTITIVVFDRF